MNDWTIQLEEADRLLVAADANGAFRTAFGALEACYSDRANLGDATGNDRFRSICGHLLQNKRISRLEFDQATHLGAARNLNVHGSGFEPSLDEARRCVERIRHLCGRFGRCVSDVMSKPVLCARPEDPVGKYIDAMRAKGISYFPVVGDDGRVIGTLDEWTLIEAVRQGEGIVDLDRPVREYMNPNPLPEIHPNASLEDAAKRLRSLKVSALVVLADRRPTGIVTAFDLLH